MSYEIERRFRHFDYAEIVKRLDTFHFTKKGTYLFRIVTFHGTKPNQLIRIRDEGYRITLVVKQKHPRNAVIKNRSFEKEWEIEVNDFDKAIEILEEIGMKKKNTIEKIREIYKAPAAKYGLSELIFDHYPGLPPYIEIEANSEENLKKITEDLGLNRAENQAFGPATLYKNLYQYQQNRDGNYLIFANMHKNNRIHNIHKNADLFAETVAKQRQMLKYLRTNRACETCGYRRTTKRKTGKRMTRPPKNTK